MILTFLNNMIITIQIMHDNTSNIDINMNMNINKNIQKFLPIYVGAMVIILIVAMLIVDKQTPKTICIFLMIMYLALLLYYWRHSRKQNNSIPIRSLQEYRNTQPTIKQPTNLQKFQQQANAILSQMHSHNLQSHSQSHYQYQSQSPYTILQYQPQYPTSLAQLSNGFSYGDRYGDGDGDGYGYGDGYFGGSNLQIWAEQFRILEGLVKEHYGGSSSSSESGYGELDGRGNTDVDGVYVKILAKYGIQGNNIKEAERIVRTFVNDRVIQYSSNCIKAVNQINKILTRNFGLTITKIQSPNPKQISIMELLQLLQYYTLNKKLPSRFQSLLISSPSSSPSSSPQIPLHLSLSLNSNQSNKLHLDMCQLSKMVSILQPMINFPNDRFFICLLVYILKVEFKNLWIQINGDVEKMMGNARKYGDGHSPSGWNWGVRDKTGFCFVVQVDNWVSLANIPEFRSKNCLKICLIFFLLLIKKQSNNNHPVLRSIYALQR